MIDAYPTTIAVVEMHVYDPPYTTTWGDERKTFYGEIPEGIPWLAYDGLGYAGTYDAYETGLNARQAVPTDVTIDLTGVETAAQTYDVTANVCIEPGGIGKTMRIYMVHVLDNWVLLPADSRNTFRKAAATQDITLASGDCAEVTQTFVFDTDSWNQQEDIKIVAWAQTPASMFPAAVHQAKVMSWPFPAILAIFVDGFETGDTSAWSEAVP